MTNLETYLYSYCRKHNCTEAEAKTHALVREVQEYYEHVNDGKISVTETKEFGCGGANMGGDCK